MVFSELAEPGCHKVAASDALQAKSARIKCNRKHTATINAQTRNRRGQRYDVNRSASSSYSPGAAGAAGVAGIISLLR